MAPADTRFTLGGESDAEGASLAYADRECRGAPSGMPRGSAARHVPLAYSRTFAYSSAPRCNAASRPRPSSQGPSKDFLSVWHGGFRLAPKHERKSMSFATLGLHSSLLETLTALGYSAPTPVQSAAIPAVLAGADLLVSSQTGSGKTAAFMLPSLHRLWSTPPAKPAAARSNGPRILVLAPTRELALQVEKAARTYGDGQRLRTACLVRRHAVWPAAEAAVAAGGHRDRDTRPPEGSPRPRPDRPRESRDPRPGRGRPHARHGVHRGHRRDRRAHAGDAPDAALLGDARRRRRPARAAA